MPAVKASGVVAATSLKPLVSSTENSAVPIEAETCWVMFISVEPARFSWS